MTTRKPRTERTPTAAQLQRFEEQCLVEAHFKHKAAEKEAKAHA
jgi:hypothetical protein